MNRLFTRIILAMLIISFVSLAIVPIAQSIALRRASENFETEFRALINDRTQPSPWFRQKNPARNRSLDDDIKPYEDLATNPKPLNPRRTNPTADTDLLAATTVENLNVRLFDYLSSYRSAQRRGVVFGVSIALLGCILLSLWLARSLARPLEAVSFAAANIAQGKLNTRVSLRNEARQPLETQALAHNFNTMAGHLEAAEGQRKAMIADIAHELRNPIASMQFRLDALSDGLLEFNQNEAEQLNLQISLLARLIEDLRTLSLADAGQLSLNLERSELSAALKQSVSTHEEKAKNTGVTLELQTATELYVNLDKQRFSQIINNLLDNALKVLDAGSSISVELFNEGDKAVILVADDGPGIDNLETIFERFVSGERRDVQTSSGLGLSIVKTLVELHGGNISASNKTQGAEFKLSFPLVP